MNKFIDLLPHWMRSNEYVQKIGATIDKEINIIDSLTEKLLLYSNLNMQSETITDELAYSFHLTLNEGYRFADTLQKKQDLVKAALVLHRQKGTLYAVKEVLNILGIKGYIYEWFEYGGEPYCFKVEAHITQEFGEKDIETLETLITEFKNIRSHLESIIFVLASKGQIITAAAVQYSEKIEIKHKENV